MLNPEMFMAGTAAPPSLHGRDANADTEILNVGVTEDGGVWEEA